MSKLFRFCLNVFSLSFISVAKISKKYNYTSIGSAQGKGEGGYRTKEQPAYDQPGCSSVAAQAGLFPNTYLLNQLPVAFQIFLSQVVQQTLPLAYGGQQGAAGSVILRVFPQVLRQFLYAVREQRDLRFRRAGIFDGATVLLKDFFLFLFGQIFSHVKFFTVSDY